MTELDSGVRSALGQSLASIQTTEKMLAPVTTPSLEALRIYSEAEELIRGPQRQQAIAILQQAIRIDPDFASSHVLLAYVLRDRDKFERAADSPETALLLQGHDDAGAGELGTNIMESLDFMIMTAIDAFDTQQAGEIDTLEMLTPDRSS
jgi:tetratricopeptide (TPR) repeat protein